MRPVLVLGIVIVIVNGVVIGCGGSARKARGPGGGGEPDPDAPELQVLERFQSLSQYVEQSGAQCERLATSIDSWMDGNQDEVEALVERARAEPGLEGDHLVRVEQRLEAVFDRVLGAVEPCRGTASLDRAFGRFDRFVEGV
ncbi:MAG TPA: hypothetical protein VMZ28_07850 [Kofleriaceae bacterium]|nr:hypothetical protein [Kofleriaceae bacterium]